MDIWLLNSTTHWRGLVTDISAFKDILPDKSQLASESVKAGKGVPGVTAVAAKKKGKDTSDKRAGTSVEPGPKTGAREAARENLQGFFDAVHWTHNRFEEEYIYNFALMGLAKFERSHRLSDRLGTRILSMCGIPWTPSHASHNKYRDWMPLVSAVTVETALIEAYRMQLICDSSGARALRQDLCDLFLKHASLYNVAGPDGAVKDTVFVWEFADKVSNASLPAGKVFGGNIHNVEDLMTRWDKASGAVSRDKKDKIALTVQALEKLPFLQCAGAKTGTIETMAHYLITDLAKVEYYHAPSFIVS